MLNMSNVLLENVDSTHEQVGNFRREVEKVRDDGNARNKKPSDRYGLNSVEKKNLVTLKIDQFFTLKHPWEKNRTEHP